MSPATTEKPIDLDTLAAACKGEGDITRTRRYRLGTLQTCPWQHLTLGGQSFPRFSTRLIKSEVDGKLTPSDPRPGIEADLTDAQVREVERALATNVIRNFGGRRPQRVTVVTTKDVRPGDVPIADHVYFEPIDAAPAAEREVRSWLAAAQASEDEATAAEEQADKAEQRKKRRR